MSKISSKINLNQARLIDKLIKTLSDEIERTSDADRRIKFVYELGTLLSDEIERTSDTGRRSILNNKLTVLLSDEIERTSDTGRRIRLVNSLKNLYQQESRRKENDVERKKMIEMAGHILRQEIVWQEDVILENNLEKEKILRKLQDKGEKSKISMDEALGKVDKEIVGAEKIKTDLINNLISIYGECDDSSKEKRPEKKGWGFHEVEITDVRFFNSVNEETNIFRTGEKFVAKIRYLAHKKIKMPLFGIAIHTENGVRITGPNTTFSRQTIDEIEGEGEVHFITETLPLLAGTYLFSVGVYDLLATYPYDQHYECYKFRVINKDIKDRYGIIHMPCKWKHAKL